MKMALRQAQKLSPIETTEVWVVFPEYTQWENRKNKLQYHKYLDYEEAAEATFRYSWRKPACSRPWTRPIGRGDFIYITHYPTVHGPQWLKLAESANGKREWEQVDWEDVFGEEANTRKSIDKMLSDLS